MRKVPHIRAWNGRDYLVIDSKDYPSTQGTSSRALIRHNWRSIGSIKVTSRSKDLVPAICHYLLSVEYG